MTDRVFPDWLSGRKLVWPGRHRRAIGAPLQPDRHRDGALLRSRLYLGNRGHEVFVLTLANTIRALPTSACSPGGVTGI